MPEPKSQEDKYKFIKSRAAVKRAGSLQITIPAEYVNKYDIKDKQNFIIFEDGKGRLLMVPFPDEISSTSLKSYSRLLSKPPIDKFQSTLDKYLFVTS